MLSEFAGIKCRVAAVCILSVRLKDKKESKLPSGVVPQCYMLLCLCVYGLQQYGRLPIMLSVLFRFVI